MSLRGALTLECDRKTCYAEIVLDAEDANVRCELLHESIRKPAKLGLAIEFYAHGWRMDDDGDVWCPDCAYPPEREKHEDDGRDYSHPGDFRRGLE